MPSDIYDIPPDRQPCYLVINRDGQSHEYVDLHTALGAVRLGEGRQLYAAWELPKLVMALQIGMSAWRMRDPTLHAFLTRIEKADLHPLYGLYALIKEQTRRVSRISRIAEEASLHRIAPTLNVLFNKGEAEKPEDG